jgi:D-alanine-D-alanine ligase
MENRVKAFDRQQTVTNAGHVAVLMGGHSAEREISLLSGEAVLQSLIRSGIRASRLDVDDKIVEKLAALAPDFALNMLHGEGGEDGVIQGFLDTVKIPYSGSGVLASALAMDKIRAKQIWLQMSLATPDYELLSDQTDWQDVAQRLGLCVVKPVSGGSSLGIAKASNASELLSAYEAALRVGARVMAESCIDGPEYTIGVLDGELLPSIELVARGELFDFEAKYLSETTQMICPADLDAYEAQELDALVISAYHALGCSGTARVDVMRDSKGCFQLLEVNTLPGMTEHSLVPRAAAELGIDFDELVLRILAENQGSSRN